MLPELNNLRFLVHAERIAHGEAEQGDMGRLQVVGENHHICRWDRACFPVRLSRLI